MTASSSTANATFRWYEDANGTTPLPASSISADTKSCTVTISGAATYYVQAIPAGGPETGCASGRVAVTVPVANQLTVSNPTATTVCPGTVTSVTMTVSSPTTNATFRWYTDAAGTTSIPAASISSDTKTCTLNLSAAATYYVQAIPSGGPSTGCASTIVPIAVTEQQVVQPSVSLPNIIATGNALNLTITGDQNYSYIWDWRDTNASQSSTGTSASHTYQQAGTYTLRITYSDRRTPTSCTAYVEYQIIVSDMLCELVLPATALSTLNIQLNKKTGSYLIDIPGCVATTTAFACLTGPALPGQGEVVAASAMSLTSALPTADPAYGVSAADLTANPYLVGGGHLLPEASYAYAAPVLETEAYTRSTERGRFQLTPFNWQVSAGFRVPAWRRAGIATRYAPDGQALEERDILRIASTVKLGYLGHSLPYLTAKNASYRQVLFESFERVDNQLQGEDGFTVAVNEARAETTRAHAGNSCLELLPVSSGAYKLTLPTFTGSWSGDVQLKLWLRVSEGTSPEQALSKDKVLAQGTGSSSALQVQWTSNAASRTNLTVVAQTGEWFLCEATLLNIDIPAAGFTPQLQYTGAGSRRLWVDDVRLQPLTGQASAYVYDWTTLKLLASFDDQHFGLYYQYNAEGKLVRKQVETERGLKTIQETQYNLPQP